MRSLITTEAAWAAVGARQPAWGVGRHGGDVVVVVLLATMVVVVPLAAANAGTVARLGGWQVAQTAGSSMVCRRSTARAMQPSGAPLATTRPQPLRTLFVPLPAVLSVSVRSSCSAPPPPPPAGP